jgi:hypothetical protein
VGRLIFFNWWLRGQGYVYCSTTSALDGCPREVGALPLPSNPVFPTKAGCEAIFLRRLVLSAPAASGAGKALSGADFNLRSSQSSLPDKIRADSRTLKFCCLFLLLLRCVQAHPKIAKWAVCEYNPFSDLTTISLQNDG